MALMMIGFVMVIVGNYNMWWRSDSMIKDKNLSRADRIKSESIKFGALAMLQNAIEVSMSSTDPHSALKKIVGEQQTTITLA